MKIKVTSSFHDKADFSKVYFDGDVLEVSESRGLELIEKGVAVEEHEKVHAEVPAEAEKPVEAAPAAEAPKTPKKTSRSKTKSND